MTKLKPIIKVRAIYFIQFEIGTEYIKILKLSKNSQSSEQPKLFVNFEKIVKIMNNRLKNSETFKYRQR